MSTVRLFLDAPLGANVEVVVERDQAHYLFNVMRLTVGAVIMVFNGMDGEWQAEVIESGKRGGKLRAVNQTRPQTILPDIELLFAPIKKARTDFIVEKACELGCARVQPVFTHHTNSERMNLPRLRAHMIEAAEQCGGLSVPTLADPRRLPEVLSQWGDRLLIFCDESREAPELHDALQNVPRGTAASILIGPEGGFSDSEVNLLRAVQSVQPVTLGPRILRADTAAIAAISLVQATLGDWMPATGNSSTRS